MFNLNINYIESHVIAHQSKLRIPNPLFVKYISVGTNLLLKLEYIRIHCIIILQISAHIQVYLKVNILIHLQIK